MTLEESRRKSGRDMEFNRQQSGRDMERNRQQSGRNMEEARRASGRKMREDMNALSEKNRPTKTLPVLNGRGPVASRRGSAAWQGSSPASSGGGGIASPLVEQSYSGRTYHDASVTLSGDMLLGMEIKPLARITMLDANGDTVIMQYAAPEG